MSRGGIRPLAALLGTLLAALLLAACGGSSNSGSTSGGEAGGQSTADRGESSQAGDAGESESEGKEAGGGKGSGKAEAKKKPDVATPLEVSGGGSRQFAVKGGDNSIQEFGDEGDESELQEAAEAVHGFFVARAEGRWADACSHLSADLLDQLGHLAEKSERPNCASFLASFTTQLPPSTWREITTVDAGSLRHEDEQAFLIYYGAPEKTVYAMPLAEEDGEWKVGALSGDALSG